MKWTRDEHGKPVEEEEEQVERNSNGRGEEETEDEVEVPEIVLLRRRNMARNAAMMAALSFDKVCPSLCSLPYNTLMSFESATN